MEPRGQQQLQAFRASQYARPHPAVAATAAAVSRQGQQEQQQQQQQQEHQGVGGGSSQSGSAGPGLGPAGAGGGGGAIVPDTGNVILHFDADSFYAQVEEQRNPLLRGRPLGVVQKYLIVTCNYAARAAGVTKLMSTAEAQRKCPGLALVSGEDLTPYRAASKAILTVLQRFGTAERLGLDEVFVDATAEVQRRVVDGRFERRWAGHVHSSQVALVQDSRYRPMDLRAQQQAQHGGRLPQQAQDGAGPPQQAQHGTGSPQQVQQHPQQSWGGGAPSPPFLPGGQEGSTLGEEGAGWELLLMVGSQVAAEARQALKSEAGYRASAGIACNKLLAKLCSGLHKPDDQTVLPPPEAAAFVAPLPPRALTGVGFKLDQELSALGVKTAQQLWAWGRAELVAKFGERVGALLYCACRGQDPSPVVERGPPKTVSVEDSFKSCTSFAAAHAVLSVLAPDLLARLREEMEDSARRPQTLTLKWRLKGTGWSRVSASCPWPQAVSLPLQGRPPTPTQAAALAAAALALLKRQLPAGGFDLTLLSLGATNFKVCGGSRGSEGGGGGSVRSVAEMLQRQGAGPPGSSGSSRGGPAAALEAAAAADTTAAERHQKGGAPLAFLPNEVAFQERPADASQQQQHPHHQQHQYGSAAPSPAVTPVPPPMPPRAAAEASAQRRRDYGVCPPVAAEAASAPAPLLSKRAERELREGGAGGAATRGGGMDWDAGGVGAGYGPALGMRHAQHAAAVAAAPTWGARGSGIAARGSAQHMLWGEQGGGAEGGEEEDGFWEEGGQGQEAEEEEEEEEEDFWGGLGQMAFGLRHPEQQQPKKRQRTGFVARQGGGSACSKQAEWGSTLGAAATSAAAAAPVGAAVATADGVAGSSRGAAAGGGVAQAWGGGRSVRGAAPPCDSRQESGGAGTAGGAGAPQQGPAKQAPDAAGGLGGRVIIHCDVDCFYCQVERLDDPSLVGVPLAVEQGNGGGFVAVSYEARAAGIRCGDGAGAAGRAAVPHLRAMGAVSQEEAKRRCPGLQVRPMRTDRYRAVAAQLQTLLRRFAPRGEVEKTSYDDFYLDVTAACCPGTSAAPSARSTDAAAVGPSIKAASAAADRSMIAGIGGSRLVAGAEGSLAAGEPLPPPPPGLRFASFGSYLAGAGAGAAPAAAGAVPAGQQREAEQLWSSLHPQLRCGALLATALRRAVASELRGMTVSCGVARSKLAARLAGPLTKPDGLTVVPDDAAVGFVRGVPLRKIPSLRGKFGEEVCQTLGVTLVGDLLAFPPDELAARFGKQRGPFLAGLPHAQDEAPVRERGPPKTLTSERSFLPNSNPALLRRTCRELVSALLPRLREDYATMGRLPSKLVLAFRLGYTNPRSKSCAVPAVLPAWLRSSSHAPGGGSSSCPGQQPARQLPEGRELSAGQGGAVDALEQGGGQLQPPLEQGPEGIVGTVVGAGKMGPGSAAAAAAHPWPPALEVALVEAFMALLPPGAGKEEGGVSRLSLVVAFPEAVSTGQAGISGFLITGGSERGSAGTDRGRGGSVMPSPVNGRAAASLEVQADEEGRHPGQHPGRHPGRQQQRRQEQQQQEEQQRQEQQEQEQEQQEQEQQQEQQQQQQQQQERALSGQQVRQQDLVPVEAGLRPTYRNPEAVALQSLFSTGRLSGAATWPTAGSARAASGSPSATLSVNAGAGGEGRGGRGGGGGNERDVQGGMSQEERESYALALRLQMEEVQGAQRAQQGRGMGGVLVGGSRGPGGRTPKGGKHLNARGGPMDSFVKRGRG